MIHLSKATAGRFCWVDLTATDADKAKVFNGLLFGWNSCEQPPNGGSFTRLRVSAQDVGSICQLKRVHLDQGVPSHTGRPISTRWTMWTMPAGGSPHSVAR